MSGNSRSGTIVRWITGVVLLCALLAGQASISPTPTAHADFVPPTFSPPEGLDFGTVRVGQLRPSREPCNMVVRGSGGCGWR
jgi:hypothetical protein